ncbi:MAG: DUF4097 family beta strand repeat-containing protein [Gemmatimonadales bacterium]|jgi:hypothetical protein
MKYRVLSAVAITTLATLTAESARAQQEWSFEGDRLLVTNLIGEITVRGHDGSRIIVRARPGGSDANLLDYQLQRGGQAEFHVVYPLDRATHFRAPAGWGGRTDFRLESWVRDSDFLKEVYSDISDRERIRIGGGGDLEVWADLEILVPRGVSTRVKIAVGEIKANDVEAPIDLDTHSGRVTVRNIRGDTRVDTGSGSVEVSSIRGSLNVDTGSGSVEVSDVEGERLFVDTGSGRVVVDGAKVSRFEVDTGSGSVRTSAIETDDAMIDTGSGAVTLDLVRMGAGNFVIDTGSGGVTVNLPTDASVRINAETGSGGIDLEVPNAMLRRMSRDEVELEIGDGRAQMTIDTGSGGIKIRNH